MENKMSGKMPELVYWDTWLSYVLGKEVTFSQIRGDIGEAIRRGQSKIGYDTPPNQNDLLLNRLKAFSSMQFKSFPIDSRRSNRELYLITQALKRHEEYVHPPKEFSQLEYYGPAFRDVEEGFVEADSAKIRRGIDNLIDLKLHD